ncbi:uncharacterized protein BT62DRAFT_1002201 [Guyanagaster necrorhizus]|uniref:Uncharacterized protein n=1 Tax=Guyanagaster necrorhizus TaxID=856835 RepID=A0A9P7W012_9AGAR|nr:uncharacterized protein BT62DRAFT_1002201 [Guyanagaster necrorhizus MCA 3950]KAG7449890.1 hypothetical protein BT62DRAFT_1002201 [Guyanagaster necrorhizus MCA 3950]
MADLLRPRTNYEAQRPEVRSRVQDSSVDFSEDSTTRGDPESGTNITLNQSQVDSPLCYLLVRSVNDGRASEIRAKGELGASSIIKGYLRRGADSLRSVRYPTHPTKNPTDTMYYRLSLVTIILSFITMLVSSSPVPAEVPEAQVLKPRTQYETEGFQLILYMWIVYHSDFPRSIAVALVSGGGARSLPSVPQIQAFELRVNKKTKTVCTAAFCQLEIRGLPKQTVAVFSGSMDFSVCS